MIKLVKILALILLFSLGSVSGGIYNVKNSLKSLYGNYIQQPLGETPSSLSDIQQAILNLDYDTNIEVGYQSILFQDPSRAGSNLTTVYGIPNFTGEPSSAYNNNRLIYVDIFYPCDARLCSGLPPVDTLFTIDSSIYQASGFNLGHLNAPISTKHSKYPLIVFSPGDGSHSGETWGFGTNIVPFGYIVAMIRYHQGDYDVAGNYYSNAGHLLLQNRALDMSFVITGMLNSATFGRKINANQIISSGHSYGGFAARVLTSGAPTVLLPAAPNGLLYPVPQDTRVIAVVSFDPSLFVLPYSTLLNMNTPVMDFASAATWDRMGHWRSFAATSNPDHYLLYLSNNTQHDNMEFSGCDFQSVLIAIGNPSASNFNAFCQSVLPAMPQAQINQILTAYTIAFLETIVKENTKYSLLLNPQNAYVLENGGFQYWKKNWNGQGNAQWQGITSVTQLAFNAADAATGVANINNYYYDGNFTYWTEQPNYFAF